jgi:hypothetical protein
VSAGQQRADQTSVRVRLGTAAVVLSAVWGSFLTFLVARGELPVQDRLGEIVPMGVLLLSQAAIAAVGGIRSPRALVAAGIVGLPLCLVSFAGVGFPYLIPSVLFFVAAGRSSMVPSGARAAIGLLIAAALIGAFILATTSTEYRCWIVERVDGERRAIITERSGSDATSIPPGGISGGCSEITSDAAAIRSTALSVVAIVGGGLLLRPRRSMPA